MKDNKITLERVSFLLLVWLVLDCAILGGGSILKIGGISYRIFIFAFFVFCSLPLVIRNLRDLLKNKYFIFMLMWGIWLICSSLIGIFNNNNVEIIIANLIGFASVAMVPGVLTILNTKKRIHIIMNVLAICTVIIFIQSLIVLIVYLNDIELYERISDYMIVAEIGGTSDINSHIVRIFLRSAPISVLGLLCTFYLTEKSEHKILKVFLILNMALCLMSLLLTYTRSIYLGLIVGLGIMLFGYYYLYRLNQCNYMKIVKISLAVVVTFLMVLCLFNVSTKTKYLSYGIYRLTSIEYFKPVDDLNTSTEEVTKSLEESVKSEEVKNLKATNRLDEENSDNIHSEEDTENENIKDDKKDNVTDTKKEPASESNELKNDEINKDTSLDNYENLTISEKNTASDNFREETKKEIFENIKSNLLIGKGLGTVLECRADRDNANEYFYLDVLMKSGIVGLIIFLMPMVALLLFTLKNLTKLPKDDAKIVVTWIAGLLSVAAFSIYNPYLNGINGFMVYACTMGVCNSLENK